MLSSPARGLLNASWKTSSTTAHQVVVCPAVTHTAVPASLAPVPPSSLPTSEADVQAHLAVKEKDKEKENFVPPKPVEVKLMMLAVAPSYLAVTYR